jgi:hypothetical protein
MVIGFYLSPASLMIHEESGVRCIHSLIPKVLEPFGVRE